MLLSELLNAQQSCAKLSVDSKDALLREVSERAASSLVCPAKPIEAALRRREELGSTGLGQGVAIPHARLAEVQRPVGFLFRLKHRIEFDAIDGQPVDLVFVLLLPTAFHEQHLSALALVARRFREISTAQLLRTAKSDADLCAAFVGETQ